MVLQLASIHTLQKHCAHAQLSQGNKGHFTPPPETNPAPQQEVGIPPQLPAREDFFPSMCLTASLAQTVMFLNIIQFCTSSLPVLITRQILSWPLAGGSTRQVGSRAHSADRVRQQTSLREPSSCLCASWGTKLLLKACVQPQSLHRACLPRK